MLYTDVKGEGFVFSESQLNVSAEPIHAHLLFMQLASITSIIVNTNKKVFKWTLHRYFIFIDQV